LKAYPEGFEVVGVLYQALKAEFMVPRLQLEQQVLDFLRQDGKDQSQG
jgi:hypothetical protein